ncbi:MAG: TolC family protein [Burkholderiaceae bacterium]|nr:TolC family protein [Burkholderiaceae bacterium]
MPSPTPSRPAALRAAAALLAAATLSACAPMHPLVQDEPPTTREQSMADRQAVQRDVPPLGMQLTLDEAIARALKFNLDRRARQMEEAFALRQFEESGYDRLPKLMAAAGYTARDKDHIARSIDSVTGLPSLANPSISQDRERVLGSLTLSWSLLDYGLARYNMQQAGDRLLAAAERRRKATHLLIRDVRIAYWRAASAQRLRDDVRASLALAEEALADSRKAEEEKLRSPLETLRYRRQLTENMRLLESIEQELATARFDLAALINVPVMAQVKFSSDEAPSRGDPLATPAEAMEEQALMQNADLREHLYQRRIAVIEARKVIVRAYPNLTLSLGALHDTDSHLIHSTWAEAGVNLSFNLFRLLSLPAQKRTAQAAIDLADQRRLAAHVALITQVHVAREQLAGARRQFERTDALWKLDTQILDQTQRREQAQAGSKLDRVAAQTTAIISVLRRYQALAHWHAAVSQLQATLGIDPLRESSDELGLDALREQVRKNLLES